MYRRPREWICVFAVCIIVCFRLKKLCLVYRLSHGIEDLSCKIVPHRYLEPVFCVSYKAPGCYSSDVFVWHEQYPVILESDYLCRYMLISVFAVYHAYVAYACVSACGFDGHSYDVFYLTYMAYSL